MKSLALVSQVVIALGLLNVWLLRAGKPSSWRGGSARTMKEEFEVYGLPPWCMSVIGFLKVSLAILLIAGVWFPSLAKPAAIGAAILMAGAVAMHVKVKDPMVRSLPALALLVFSLVVLGAPSWSDRHPRGASSLRSMRSSSGISGPISLPSGSEGRTAAPSRA